MSEETETVLGECELSQIENLAGHAVKHDNGGEPCLNYRTKMVARLMIELELDICDLGFIASDFLDLLYAPDEPEGDSVLDAKEIDDGANTATAEREG